MPTVKIVEHDLAKLAIKKSGTSVLKLKPIPLVVSIDVDDKLNKALGEDPLLLQQMVDKANKKIDKIAEELGGVLKETAVKIQKTPGDKEKFEDEAEKEFEKVAKQAEKDVPLEVMKTWEKLKTRKAEYKAYKIKAGIKIATSGAAITASVATTAVGGFTGVGTVVGIVGIVKSLSNLAQEIVKLGKSAKTTMGELEDMLTKVAEKYKSETKGGKVGLEELGKEVLAGLTSFKMTSIKKCGDWDKLLGDKLNGVEVNAHEISKQVNKILNELQKVQAELPKYLDKLKPNMPSDQVVKIMGQAGKVEKKVMELFKKSEATINKCRDTAVEAKDGRKSHKILHEKVVLLEGKVPEWSKVLQKAVPLLEFATCSSWDEAAQTLAGVAADAAQETETFDKMIKAVTK